MFGEIFTILIQKRHSELSEKLEEFTQVHGRRVSLTCRDMNFNLRTMRHYKKSPLHMVADRKDIVSAEIMIEHVLKYGTGNLTNLDPNKQIDQK